MKTRFIIHMQGSVLMGHPRSVSCNCFSLSDLETNLLYALSNGYSVIAVENCLSREAKTLDIV